MSGTAVDRYNRTFNTARRKVVAKTADYTVTPNDAGTLFTNRGASGAVVFTLPAAAAATGIEFEFAVVANQNVTIAAPADTLVAFNDATATSIAFSTTSEKVGSNVRVVSDGTSWISSVHLAAETATPTIA